MKNNYKANKTTLMLAWMEPYTRMSLYEDLNWYVYYDLLDHVWVEPLI